MASHYKKIKVKEMTGFVFENEQSAQDALAAVNTYADYPRDNTDVINGGKSSTTNTYCDIISHPVGSRWAIVKDHVTAGALPELEDAELGDGWWNTI
jgi:hypothetical protein